MSQRELEEAIVAELRSRDLDPESEEFCSVLQWLTSDRACKGGVALQQAVSLGLDIHRAFTTEFVEIFGSKRLVGGMAREYQILSKGSQTMRWR